MEIECRRHRRCHLFDAVNKNENKQTTTLVVAAIVPNITNAILNAIMFAF